MPLWPWSRPVAVVALRGTIGMAVRAEQWVPLLDSLRRRRSVRALVIEVDSPGGTVAASDYIYGALARLAEVKPVFAFSGNLCASGGYLVAAAARELIVQPAAVVGSIGVISIRPLAEDFLRRYGLAVGVTKSGELKDTGAFWRKPTEKEREKEQALVDEYFALFLERIEAGRKIDPARLRELATGEVFSGRQAVAVGLADRVGTLDDAVEAAAAAAGVPRRARWYRVRRSLRSRLFGGIGAELSDQLAERLLALTEPQPRF
ncbi:MAG TPA: signal peptide peptidase SppA [Candidatus Dormibacteraeota bacterium]|nr:signal peptide peptidase SppA [Candidatus Dormibacteraeota bacterium]